MIRHLTKYFTILAVLVLNSGCVYNTGSAGGSAYVASFAESSQLCRYVDPKSLQDVSKLDVHYIPQKPNYCGPASVAMVLGYMGDNVTQDQIGEGIVDSSGTTPAELQSKVTEYGYHLGVATCSLNNLLSLIDDGKPVIVRILKKGSTAAHYLVVTGYDLVKEIVYVNDPEDKKLVSISFVDFKQLWNITTLGDDQNSENLMLIVSL